MTFPSILILYTESMMYYRRKVILSLLQMFNNSLQKTKFQKLLFLFASEQETPSFDFVPYRYGCYSFQAIYDLGALIRNGHILDNGEWTVCSEENYLEQLKVNDRLKMREIKKNFGNLSLNKLIEYVYTQYPYYAINSEIAPKHVSHELLNQQKSHSTNQQVFTIGYEGISLEQYLNELIQNNIQLLVDVRNNPVSMKNGFSKNQLKNTLEKFKIKYIHLPALGIPSDLRKKYITKKIKNYDALFLIYKNKLLSENQAAIDQLKKNITQFKRVALTCFEYDPDYCHRKIIANKITKEPIHIMYGQKKNISHSKNISDSFQKI